MSEERDAIADKLSAISRLKYANPEDALREVAEQVLSGNGDPLFRMMLARMLHPDRPPLRGRKLVLSGPNGRPPAARAWELEEFLEVNIDIHGVPTKIAFHEASKRFTVSRTVAAEALARARKDRDPELFNEERKTVRELARRGHPDFQPVWCPKK